MGYAYRQTHRLVGVKKYSAEMVIIKLGMYIMTPEPISTAYFINPSDQSACMSPYRC
jgi:hypothetical protein